MWPSHRAVTFSRSHCLECVNRDQGRFRTELRNSQEENTMFSSLFTRRAFAARVATLFPGLGLAAAVPAPAPAESKDALVQKRNWDGKPADPHSFITPLIIHNEVIYIA